MPKRWERELRRLGDVPAPTERIHARSIRPSEPGNPMPPARQRVVAGIVAFGVFIAAGAFLVRAIAPSERDQRAVGPTPPLPTLEISLNTSTTMQIGVDPSPWQVEAVFEYGEVRDESVTTSPPGRLPMSVEELPRLFPAPTVGSSVSIESEAHDPRVMILKAEEWPNLDKLDRIDRLPSEPGDYVVFIEAEFATGPARVVRAVSLVAPGTVQVVSTEGGGLDAAVASLAIDGESHDGFLATSSYTVSDLGAQSQPRDPSFSEDDYIEVERRAPIVVGGGPDTLVKSLFREGDDIRLPRWRGDMLNVDPGRYLLTLTATWKHGKTGWVNDGTLEEATFKFPIEIVGADDPDATSTQIPDTSAGEPSDVLRIRCEEGRATVLTPVVAAGPNGVEVEVLPLGGEHRVVFREEGYPTGSFVGSIPADGRSHHWGIAPGDAEVACNVSLEGTVPFEVVDPAGHYAGAELECESDAPAEVVGYDGGAAEWIDEEAAIRGILRGVRETDRVVPSLYGRDRLARWSIVRDDSVVGLVTFTPVTVASDPRGSGLGRVDGLVCSASDIDGTVRPRDPDGDGIALDCAARSQVAFRHRGLYLLPAGESAIRANVPGVRLTDELLPPAEGSGVDGMDGVWTVVRDEKTVASIVYPELDGITCRFNAIGVRESG